ncbi:MAG: YeeE/YedE family protein [Akkermansiaceae bacterium]
MLEGSYTFYHALIGGVFIGLASFLASYATGKIPGISGVCAKLLIRSARDKLWRGLFLIGLLVGAAAAFSTIQSATQYQSSASLPVIGLAGLLVGLGTRIGGGCTSGHGVCGIGLGAKDSLVATVTFMAFGIMTVFLVRQLLP